MHETVIVDAVRTPFGKRGGVLKDIHPADLLGHVFGALVSRSGVDPASVDDVIIGCVNPVGEQGSNIGRTAWLSAGYPETVPAVTIDRKCGSSLQALHFAAQGVMAGAYDVVIAGGVESMSRVPLGSNMNRGPGTPLTAALDARYGLNGGWFNQVLGAQLIAERWRLSRAAMDELSFESHRRAAAARAADHFDGEIVPMTVRTESGDLLKIERDEGIRDNTSIERLSTLPPAFEGAASITAGNASQISDGASGVLVMSAARAMELGLRARARFKSFSVVGVDPVSMLTGPIPATRKALERAGLTVDEIDLFEVNEAFASVVLSWQAETGVPMDRVNVNGGAIALGHPVGASGTRLIGTILNELERRQQRYGLVAICEGGGMANGTIIERL